MPRRSSGLGPRKSVCVSLPAGLYERALVHMEASGEASMSAFADRAMRHYLANVPGKRQGAKASGVASEALGRMALYEAGRRAR